MLIVSCQLYTFEVFKKVFYNTGAQVIGKAVTATTTLLVTLIIGRSLGPTGYGEFTKIFVFVGYFYTLVDFGLNSVFIKLQQEEKSKLFSGLFALRIVWGFTLVLLSIMVSFLLPYDPIKQTGFSPQVKTGIIIASLTILTHAIYTTSNAYFQKKLSYNLSTIAAISGYAAILILTLIFTLTKSNLLIYVAAYVVGGVVMAIISLWLILRYFKTKIIPLFDVRLWLKLTKESWPVGIALIFNLIYFRIDVFILSNLRSTYEVGLYGLSYQFFEAALAVPIFFANAIFPILNRLYKSNLKDFRSQAKSWALILLVVSLIVTLGLIAIAGLIPVIYDERFQGSQVALQILALGMPFFFLSALIWHLLIIYGKQKFLSLIYAIGAVFNLAANLVLIPIYGYLAAAAVTVVSEVLILMLLILALRRAE